VERRKHEESGKILALLLFFKVLAAKRRNNSGLGFKKMRQRLVNEIIVAPTPIALYGH